MKNKLSKYIYAALLTLCAAMPVTAQQRQDAMYIFRNDGVFNAFFFDDIERIDFSMVDTLGALHESYVVQEIYALDSVYRIPLSAIDSVSFITPETKYKEGVVKMEESLRDYITAVDGMTLTLSGSTPESLLPVNGTKLSLLEVNDLFPYGFAGEVVSVNNSGGGYTVVCDSADLADLFEFLVIKVAAEGSNEANVKAVSGRRRAEYELEPTHIDLAPVEGSLSLTSSFGFTDELSADIGASVGYKLKPSIDIRAFLYVGVLDGVQFTSTVRAQLDTEMSLDVSGSFTCHIDMPITKIPIPLGQPFVRVDTDLGFFTEGQGSLNAGYQLNTSSRLYGYTYFDSSLFGKRELDANVMMLSVSDEWKKITGKATISAGMYLETGVVAVSKKLGKISLRADAGVRASVEAELKKEDFDLLGTALPTDKALEAATSKTLIYDILNRDASLDMGGFADVQAIAKLGSWTRSLKREEVFPIHWGGSGGLVPNFLEVLAEPDPYDDTHCTLSARVGRKTPFPNRLGFNVFDDKGKLVSTLWNSSEYWGGEPTNFSVSATGLQPGIKYTAMPVTSFLGWDLPAKPSTEFMTTIEGLKLAKEEVSFEYDETDEKTVNIGTNCTNLEVKFEKETPWLTAAIVKKTLHLSCTENTGKDIREATLIVSGLSPDGETLTAQLLVSQLPEVHGFLMVKSGEATWAMDHDPSYVNTPMHVVPTKEEQEEDGWEPYDMGFAIPFYDHTHDVEDIFKRHRYIEPDEQGNFNMVKDGLTMKGTFDKKTGKGSGTFELSTTFLYRQAPWETLVNYYRYSIEFNDAITFNSLYEGTLSHEAKGTFTIAPSSEGENTYVFILTGNGTYRLEGTYIDQITNWEANGWLVGTEYPNAQLHTNSISLYPGCSEPYYGDELPCTFTINKYQLHYRFSE